MQAMPSGSVTVDANVTIDDVKALTAYMKELPINQRPKWLRWRIRLMTWIPLTLLVVVQAKWDDVWGSWAMFLLALWFLSLPRRVEPLEQKSILPALQGSRFRFDEFGVTMQRNGVTVFVQGDSIIDARVDEWHVLICIGYWTGWVIPTSSFAHGTDLYRAEQIIVQLMAQPRGHS